MAQKLMSRAIVVDLEHCLACNACESACARAHVDAEDLAEALASGQPAVSRVRVRSMDGRAVPVQCQHCEDPVCVTVCPSEALRLDEERGRVITVPDNCTGCRACVRACPYGAVFWSDRLQAAVKCDLCEGIVDEGEEPSCIAACPTRCRHVFEVDEDMEREYTAALRDGRAEVVYAIDEDECICCGRCARECPVDAIEGEAGKAPARATEEDRKKGKVGTPFAIDQDICVQCGRCFEICPVNAVAMT